MICLTSNVSDAFSRTDRISQLYELSNAGEFGKFLEYSINTYKRTILVIKGDKEFTEIIEDKIGAKQGAKKSAPDFKLYNIPLDKLIKDSNLGYKCFGIDVGLLLVADDSMSIVQDIEALKAIINLYVWYSKNYAVNFAFNKTIITSLKK